MVIYMDYEQRIADLLKSSRESAGISIRSMAKAMNVAPTTIQNWECGYSQPKTTNIMQWFDVLDIPIYPYMLKLNHPELVNVNANSSDKEIKDALISVINDLDMTSIRKHYFELLGEHGTPPDGMGEVKTAYLHLPMRDKIVIASIICNLYELSEANGTLTHTDCIMPDIVALKKYIESAKAAFIDGKDSYIVKE